VLNLLNVLVVGSGDPPDGDGAVADGLGVLLKRVGGLDALSDCVEDFANSSL